MSVSTPEARPDYVDLRMQLKDGVLHLVVPRAEGQRRRARDILVIWMIGSSLVLMAIAVVFLRNQIKPIERLVRAAEAFARAARFPTSSPTAPPECVAPPPLSSRCAMRIDRFVQQRTDMLAGISTI